MNTFNMTHTINEDGTMTNLHKSTMYYFDAEQVLDDKEMHEIELEHLDEWIEKNM